MNTFIRLIPLSLLLTAPHLVQAQQRSPAPARTAPMVPRDMLPPAGKCRIWMDDVAPAQQPAPTDCQTALRQRTSNGTVVFGPSAKEPMVNAFGTRATPGREERTDSSAREARPRNTPRTEPRAEPRNAPRTDSTARRRPRPKS